MGAGGFLHPDYEVFGELGRGAFGTVFRARRKGMQDCAVKVFDPGRVDLARAARELEKLQRVQEHRGVVTVYDFDLSGAAPFYAMGQHAERGADGLWRGRTLAGLCGKVPEKEAWRLIGEIAEALAYLHEHEVIHCDVKPGNVLLTDERPVGVKVCDFGQSRGSAGQWGERAGTVGYAAPEQLEKPGDSGDGRGYRWDVYGFGVTAFELLTGRWPRLEGVRTESAGDAATLRESLAGASLCEGGSGGPVAEVVARLRAEGDAVRWPAGSKLDRELCAVIERCLAMDPTKRFGDMRAVAEALRAVETRRALARNRRILATVCGLAALAGAGALGIGWQWRRAEVAWAEAERSHLSAEAGRERAEELVDFMVRDIGGKLRQIGKLELMDSLLKAAERYHSDRDRAEAAGIEQRSPEEMLRRAGSLANLAQVCDQRGDLEGALRMYGQAREMFGCLPVTGRDRARVLVEILKIERAVGYVLWSKGDLQAGASQIDSAIARGEALVAEDPQDAEFQNQIAESLRMRSGLYRGEGRLKEALDALVRSAEILEALTGRDSPRPEWSSRLAQAYEDIGAIQKRQGDGIGALKSRGRAVELAEMLVTRAPDDMTCQYQLSVRLLRWATELRDNRDPEGAARALSRALEICERFGVVESENLGWEYQIAGVLALRADMQMQGGDLPGALSTRRRGLAVREKLTAQDAKNMEWTRMFGHDLRRMAETQWMAGDKEAALESVFRSEEVLSRVASHRDRDADWRFELFQTVEAKGRMLKDLGRSAEALSAYRCAKNVMESLISGTEDRPAWRSGIKRVEEAVRSLETAKGP